MNINSTTLTYETWDKQAAERMTHQLKDTIDVLKWGYEQYGEDIIYACSFGVEGIVLIDLISKVRPDAKIVFLDTGLHFKETDDLIEKVKDRYPQLNVERVKPTFTVEEQARIYGDELWKRNPNLCCQMRKIEPLKRTLKGYKAWISGLRREQSPTRRHTEFVNKDKKFHLIKICPLIHWTWEEIWAYVDLNGLPYNELHDRGYPSIGCLPCTSPATDLGDFRSGRWAGFEKTECGLHQ
jgi:phosphoadenosine phosphosulfate reductase